MTIFDLMGDFSESGEVNFSFRFDGTVYQFPVRGTLAKNNQSATQRLNKAEGIDFVTYIGLPSSSRTLPPKM